MAGYSTGCGGLSRNIEQVGLRNLLEARDGQQLGLGALDVHDRLGGAAHGAIRQRAGDPALAAGKAAAQDPDGGFQSAASRSRRLKLISGQSWRMQSQ